MDVSLFLEQLFIRFFVFFLLTVKGKVDLKISDDIDSHPGPDYVVKKGVWDTFHQGKQKLGSTAGIQYICNSLYTLSCPRVPKVFVWNSPDLHHILIQGGNL